MTTNLYLYKANKEHGPYQVADIKGFLQKNQLTATVMARFDGSGDWVPLYCIPAIREDPSMAAITKGATSGDPQIEFAIVEGTAKEAGLLIDRLSSAVAGENQELQNIIQRRMQILWRQVYTFKGQFPSAMEAKMLERTYYRLQALTKFNAAGFLRRQQQEANNVVWGLFTGLLAKRQEQVAAEEALSLLHRAVSVYDNPEDRFTMALINHLLGKRDDTLRELGRIMVDWSPAENLEEYIQARQMRDEIELA